MEIDLTKKIVTIFGLNMSGKSYFVKNAIIPNYKCLVFDPNSEYDKSECDVYRPKYTTFPAVARENEKFLGWVKKNKARYKHKIVDPLTDKETIEEGKYDLIIWDEADSIFPNKKPLFPLMDNLKGKYRHENKWGGIGIIFLCRRPAQLFTDFPSLSHYIFTFGNKGAPDKQRLNSEAEGLGDQAKLLSDYRYIVVSPDRQYEEHPPI